MMDRALFFFSSFFFRGEKIGTMEMDIRQGLVIELSLTRTYKFKILNQMGKIC